MTQRYMLEIAKKYNINNVCECMSACEFVEELLKEMIIEMEKGNAKSFVSDSIIKDYLDANWAVGDLCEEMEVMK